MLKHFKSTKRNESRPINDSIVLPTTLGQRGEKGVDRILDIFEGLGPIIKIILMLGMFTMNGWMGYALAGGNHKAGCLLAILAVCCDVSLLYWISRYKSMQGALNHVLIFSFCMFLFLLSAISSIGFGLWIETLIETPESSKVALIDESIRTAKWRLETLPGGSESNPNNAIEISREIQRYVNQKHEARAEMMSMVGYAPELAIFHKFPFFKNDPDFWAMFTRLAFALCVVISPILIGCLGGGVGMKERQYQDIPTLVPFKNNPRVKVDNVGDSSVKVP